MGNDLKQKRIALYRNAPEVVRDAYASEDLGGVIQNIALHNHLSDTSKGELTGVVGDIILGLVDRQDCESMLIARAGISKDAAVLASRECKPFFDKALGVAVSVPVANSDFKERLDLRPEETPNKPAPVASQPAPKPLTREELMNALAPKRTMAGDMEALRQKGAATGATPPPTPPTPSA